MKVLLADDDADQLDLRSQTLTKAGYEILAATDPDAALSAARRDRPDVAILDLKIPTEEAGLRLIRELNTLDSHMRLIVLTGSAPKRVERHPEHKLLEAVFIKGNSSRQLIDYLKRKGCNCAPPGKKGTRP